MIVRDDILSMEFFKKTEYTGCHKGMRYRIEGVSVEDGKKLKAMVWPEPFNYFTTPVSERMEEVFDFSEDGIVDAIAWMNDMLFAHKDKWDRAGENWGNYVKILDK